MQQVRDRAVSTRLPRAIPASPAQARSVSHGDATYELRVQKGPSHDATRRRMAQKSPYRAESAVLLRGAAGTSGAQKLVTRPTGGPEEGQPPPGARSARKVSNSANRMSSASLWVRVRCGLGMLAACKTLASKAPSPNGTWVSARGQLLY